MPFGYVLLSRRFHRNLPLVSRPIYSHAQLHRPMLVGDVRPRLC